MKRFYLDNAATTPLSEDVKYFITSYLNKYGNPSSIYKEGVEAKKILDEARKNVADFINAEPDEIIFTSGGSASNTLAIRGIMSKNYTDVHDKVYHCLYSPTSHKSILKCVEHDKYNIYHKLKVDKRGKIEIDQEKDLTIFNGGAPFVVIEYVNSEIGTIQPVKDIIGLIHKYNGIVYLDCTGGVSTIPLDVKKLDVDMVGFSAHKLGALKGTGVLYKKKNIKLEPLVYGSQEKGLFGGTENVLGIGALGVAVKNYKYNFTTSKIKYLWDKIKWSIPNCYLVGALWEERQPLNLNICFKDVDSETLVTYLDMYGISCSSGSACNADSIEPSSTYTEIGLDKKRARSCVRFTLNGKEKYQDLQTIANIIVFCVERLREF